MQTSTQIKNTGLTGTLRKALQTDECGQKLVRGTSSTVTSRQQTEIYHDGHVPVMQLEPLRLQGSASGCQLSRACSVALTYRATHGTLLLEHPDATDVVTNVGWFPENPKGDQLERLRPPGLLIKLRPKGRKFFSFFLFFLFLFSPFSFLFFSFSFETTQQQGSP